MVDGDLTGREGGEADARERMLEMIRQRAIAMFGSNVKIMKQVERVGSDILSMASKTSFGPEPAVKTVRWELSA